MKRIIDKKITFRNDLFSKKYDPSLMQYSCPICLGTLDDSKCLSQNIEDYSSINEINNYFKFRITEYEAFINSDYISFIRESEIQCDKCNYPVKFNLLHFVSKIFGSQAIEDYFTNIISTDDCEIKLQGFLGLGLDIRTMINNLYLRWFTKGYSIDCIIPFVQAEYLNIFVNILKYSQCYEPKLSELKLKLKRNPFNKIIFRNIQNKSPLTDFKNIATDYMDNHLKSFYPQFNINELFDSIWIAENPNKIRFESEKNFKYQDNFHAKFTAGYNHSEAELLLTSYNFSDYQNLQFDTYYLDNLETSSYKNQLQMFTEYHRLKITKFKIN